MPSCVSTKIDIDPSMASCARRMPSAMVLPRLMSAATSSVALMLPPLISKKCEAPFLNACCTSSSKLLMRPTVVMA